MPHDETINNINIINDLNLSIISQILLKQLKINRIRKILLILLSILFTFDLIYLIFIVHVYIDHSKFHSYFKNNYELLWTLLSVIYDAFGLLVIYQYYRTGLCVFAWIGTGLLILTCVTIGIILFIASLNNTSNGTDLIGPIIFLIIFFISTFVLLIIVIFSFKLLKLIPNPRNIINQSL